MSVGKTDRPLTHINKKGRPVSQCPHCRGLRKARASHVACECGVKAHGKDDCESEWKSEEAHSDSTSDPGAEQLHNVCCCTHGMRCTCALKKEHLDPVPEIDSVPVLSRKRTTSAPKPRLLKAGSENTLTVFTNGHHKPVHKHNDSAHNCGLPYKIPIPHSIHGNADVARRSTDSLPLIRKREEAHSQLQESFVSAQQEPRRVRSEHGSPEPGAVLFRDNNDLPALDLSYVPPSLSGAMSSQFDDGYLRSPPAYDNTFFTASEDPAGLNSVVDWSALELNGTYATSYASYDQSNVAQSGLTTSSSGDVSDAGDYISHNPQRSSLYRQDLAATTSAETRSLNRLSSSSYMSMPHMASLSTGNGPDFTSSTPELPTSPQDPELDFHRTTASPTEFEETRGLHSDAWERHGFTVHDAQKMAHPETPTEAMGGLTLPLHGDDIESPLWSGRLDPSARETAFVSQEMVEGRRWQ